MVVHGSKGVLVTDGGSVAKMPPLAGASSQPVIRRFLAGNYAMAKAVLRWGRDLLGRARQFVAAPDPASGPEDPLRLPRETGHLTVIEQFVRHLREGTAPPVSWEEAYFTMRLVDQIGRGIQAAVER
jgi:hypothetical protein